MTSEDQSKLVKGLLSKTKSGELKWNSTDAESCFAVSFQSANIVIRYERDLDSNDVYIDLYDLKVFNRADQLVCRLSNVTDWPGRGDAVEYPGTELAELFIAARDSIEDPDLAELLRRVVA